MSRKRISIASFCLLLLVASGINAPQFASQLGSSSSTTPTTIEGNYVYKTHREGKGGFDNTLEIRSIGNGRFHVSFEGTYFYLAGKDETFHEG